MNRIYHKELEDIVQAKRAIERDPEPIFRPGSDAPIVNEFECIVEPLFRQHTTKFSPLRAKKPNGSINKILYDNPVATEGVRDLIEHYDTEQLRKMNGELELAVADSFAIGRMVIDQKKRDECQFCYPRILTHTCDPKIIHDLFIDGTSNKVVSFPNISPSGILDYVTVPFAHETTPIELSLVDMDNFMHSSADVARKFMSFYGVNGMKEIINLGSAAEASQDHIHTKRIALTKNSWISQDIRADILEGLRARTGIDPVDYYLDATIDSDRLIFSNEYVVIFAPQAPKYTHEVHIFLRQPRANILELSPEERRYVGESMLGVFHFLYNEFGVTDLQMTTMQARLDIPRGSAMRLYYIIRPKNINGKPAGLEDGRLYTVYKLPEETAASGREHYSKRFDPKDRVNPHKSIQY